MHGGRVPRGKAHGAFKHGRDTAAAVEDRERAKALRAAGSKQWGKVYGETLRLGTQLIAGAITRAEAEERSEVLIEAGKEASKMIGESVDLDFGHLDRFYPGALKRRYAMSRARSNASKAKAAKRAAAKAKAEKIEE